MHAEMNVLRYSKPGDDIHVMRFKKNGLFTMAKPCGYCMKYMRKFEIRRCYYTDWNGAWNMIKIKKERN